MIQSPSRSRHEPGNIPEEPDPGRESPTRGWDRLPGDDVTPDWDRDDPVETPADDPSDECEGDDPTPDW